MEKDQDIGRPEPPRVQGRIIRVLRNQHDELALQNKITFERERERELFFIYS